MSENINCLLIDDDLDDHEFFFQAMTETYPLVGCEFSTSCEDVINRLGNHSIQVPNYIFMDWNPQNVNVKQSVKQLHGMACLKGSRIFILSGFLPVLTTENMKYLGIEKLLLKQNSIDLLCKELSQVLQ